MGSLRASQIEVLKAVVELEVAVGIEPTVLAVATKLHRPLRSTEDSLINLADPLGYLHRSTSPLLGSRYRLSNRGRAVLDHGERR